MLTFILLYVDMHFLVFQSSLSEKRISGTSSTAAMCSGSVSAFLQPTQARSIVETHLVMLEGVNVFEATLNVSVIFCYGVSDSRVNVLGSNITHAHVLEGQPRGHPMCRCPSWL
jgi:hypothetical protein